MSDFGVPHECPHGYCLPEAPHPAAGLETCFECGFGPLIAATRDSGALLNPDPLELRESEQSKGLDASKVGGVEVESPWKTLARERWDEIYGAGDFDRLVAEGYKRDFHWLREAAKRYRLEVIPGDDHEYELAHELDAAIAATSTRMALPSPESGSSGLGSASAPSPSPESEQEVEIGAAIRPRAEADESCWLIERGQAEHQVPTVWWTGGDDWTEDPGLAWKFETRDEAVSFALYRCRPVGGAWGRVTEHVFRASTTTAEPSPSSELADRGMAFVSHEIPRPVSTDEEEGRDV